MKPIVILGTCIMVLMIALGCAIHQTKPETDPVEYSVRFVDIDADGDGVATWQEFLAYFPQGEESVFRDADLNQNNMIEHREWHDFKQRQGYKHLEH